MKLNYKSQMQFCWVKETRFKATHVVTQVMWHSEKGRKRQNSAWWLPVGRHWQQRGKRELWGDCFVNEPFGYLHRYIWDFPGGLVVKNLPANAGDVDSIPGMGRSPEEGNGNSFGILVWEIPKTGAWQATVHGVTEFRHDLATKQQVNRGGEKAERGGLGTPWPSVDSAGTPARADGENSRRCACSLHSLASPQPSRALTRVLPGQAQPRVWGRVLGVWVPGQSAASAAPFCSSLILQAPWQQKWRRVF